MERKQPKLDIYIDFLFLKAFFENKPTDDLSKDYRNWLDFYLWLTNSQHINIITAKDGKVMKLNDFRVLLQERLSKDDGRREEFFKYKTNFDKTQYTNSPTFDYWNEIKNPHSLFFLEFSKEEIETLNKTGFWFLNYKEFLNQYKLLFLRESIFVSSDDEDTKFYSWEKLQEYQTPCNTIFITDNYMALSVSKVKKNLAKLIENVIKTGSENVQVALVYSTTKPEETSCNARFLEPDKLHRIIKETLENIPVPNIQIKVIRPEKNHLLHSRFFLNNYFYYNIAHNVNFFKNNGTEVYTDVKETKITFESLLNEDVFISSCKQLKIYKTAIENTSNDCLQRVYGDNDNKLLDYEIE